VLWLQIALLTALPLQEKQLSFIGEADSLCRKYHIQIALAFAINPELPPEAFRLIRQGPPYSYLIESSDTSGWAYGVWTLLQEGYGLLFPHPKIILRVDRTPDFDTLTAIPRFRWRGFHLHTQHPLELTEVLHNPHHPQAYEEILEYLRWLQRNGQNYFEFCLLRTVNRRIWLPYFREIVNQAKAMGIMVGLDVSLRMQQQYAYQMLPRGRLESRKRRLARELDGFASLGVCCLNVELTSAEFVGKDWGPLLTYLDSLAQTRGLRLLTRQHVVPPESYARGSFRSEELPTGFTLAVHSVMGYGLQDTLAPVYRCQNFHHLYQTLLQERHRREVWYYPESAYWVTFDNSVPVWLLSYLRSRWEDIELVSPITEGHLTFSSGWDVGYWLFDWRIARWSWGYHTEIGPLRTYPADGFVTLFGGDSAAYARLIRFQDSVMVGRNLLSYLTPTTPIDELGWRWLPALQPRLPHPPWKVWRNPWRYRPFYEPILEGWRKALQEWPAFPPHKASAEDPLLHTLYAELSTAWEITRLRAEFRYWYLKALLAPNSRLRREAVRNMEVTLASAERLIATLPIRYPATAQRRLCRAGHRFCRHPHPSYRFGYLYPAVSLHFWRRELGQVKEGRWSPFYKNLWNIARITGLY